MNRLDKPFKAGDRVIVKKAHYPERPVGTTDTLHSIPQERWHNNEVTVAWDDGEFSTLACTVLDLLKAED
jgi:hypothetical protein